MHRTRKILSLSLALGAAVVTLTPTRASARNKGVLEGEPVVRKKLQLRRMRFQLTPAIGMTLSQPFVHVGYVGAKAGFHITEWMGIRAGFMYGAVKLKSKLHKDLTSSGGLPEGVAPGQVDNSVPNAPMCAGPAPCRPAADSDNPAPLLHDFKAGLTYATWQSSLDLVFTPFVGKLGLFSALFTEYDVYVFGGLGIMGWNQFYKGAKSTAELEGLDTKPEIDGQINPNYCRNTASGLQNDECILHPVQPDQGLKNGIHLGFSFGGGIHLFISKWAALNIEVQDIITRNNITGLNATIDDVVREGGPIVNKRDKNIFHNVTMQLGVKFYMPFKAKRSK